MVFEDGDPRPVRLDEVPRDNIHVHNSANTSEATAFALAKFHPAHGLPAAMGVIRKVDRPRYEDALAAQEHQRREKSHKKPLSDLLKSGETWTVK